MVHRKDADPSPFRSGLLHGLMSAVVFGGVAGIVGGLVHITGDPAEAGPQHVIALFQSQDGDVPALRTRLSDGVRTSVLAANDTSGQVIDQTEEPSLGVADPGNEAIQTANASQAETAPRGIRINGKLVNPGQRYSEVEQGAGASPAESAQAAPILSAARVQEALAEPAPVENDYARPFENPEGKPIVSLVVGGLGTSYRQSKSAIEELPADVTLSFVPTANPELLRYARNKGHEILLEVPMEALGRSKARAHRDTLLAEVPAEDNIIRLNSLLRGKRQLFGVISHRGDKFVTAEGAAAPILAHLQEKNLAFFQHSTLERASFSEDAAALNMVFAAAEVNIDTEIRASEIEAQLFKLETQALDEGVAFGTGFAYPLTVDLVARWSHRLRDKGILLAPASAVAAENAKQQSFQTSQLDLPDAPSDATP